jgi:hypothetical protein
MRGLTCRIEKVVMGAKVSAAVSCTNLHSRYQIENVRLVEVRARVWRVINCLSSS